MSSGYHEFLAEISKAWTRELQRVIICGESCDRMIITAVAESDNASDHSTYQSIELLEAPIGVVEDCATFEAANLAGTFPVFS